MAMQLHVLHLHVVLFVDGYLQCTSKLMIARVACRLRPLRFEYHTTIACEIRAVAVVSVRQASLYK